MDVPTTLATTIILNPTAGRGQGSQRREAIEKAFPHAQIFQTAHSGEATDLAHRAANEGAALVIAAGGDGTLGEVLNGIFGTEARLGILPVGTGNDFARTLGIGADWNRALETLRAGMVRTGTVRTVDVGKVEIGGQSRYFLNVAGAGFDSRCAARINEHRPKILAKLSGTTAYIVAVLSELRTYQTAHIRLELDGRVVESQGIMCAIANAQTYGGGMKVAPDADLSDGLFDICLIKDVSAFEFLRAFPGVFAGKHIHHPKVEMFRAAKVKLQCEPPLPVLVDGDILGASPASFEILPDAIEVLALPSYS
jgi:diacylglycerol kinase (ATP)